MGVEGGEGGGGGGEGDRIYYDFKDRWMCEIYPQLFNSSCALMAIIKSAFDKLAFSSTVHLRFCVMRISFRSFLIENLVKYIQ